MSPPTLRLQPPEFFWNDFSVDYNAPIPSLDQVFQLKLPVKPKLNILGDAWWKMPGLLRPIPFASPPAPAIPAQTKPSSTLRDVILAIESMDVTLSGMSSNGGVAGCRYSEVVPAADLAKAKCVNNFQKDTKAEARIEIRPLKGMKVSEIYRFYVHYDKPPGRTGIQVGGFYLNHPGNPADNGPLEPEREDPFESGKNFRETIRERSVVPLRSSVEYYTKASDLIMQPQGWLYDSSKLADFDITKGLLMANGLINEQTYKDLGTGAFQIPRRLDKFFDLFSKADSCYPKRPGAKVVAPNFIHDVPPLIEWLGPEKIEVDLVFRPSTISLGNLGSLELGKSGENKVKIRGDTKQTTLEIELKDVQRVDLQAKDFQIGGSGMRVGKLIVTLPPIKQIAKEMGWLDVKKAEDVIKACLGEAPVGTKIDRSPYLKKIFSKIELKEVHADELTIENRVQGGTLTLSGADLASVVISELNQIELKSGAIKAITFREAQSEIEASAKDAALDSLSITLKPEQMAFKAAGMKIADFSLRKASALFHLQKGEIKSFGVDFNPGKELALQVEGIKTQGSVQLAAGSPDGLELQGGGKSNIESLKILANLANQKLNKISAELKFNGTIDRFNIGSSKTGNFNLRNTVLADSVLKFSYDFSGAVPAQNVELNIKATEAQISQGHIYFAEIGESTLKNGQILLTKVDQDLNLSLSGKLDLVIPTVDFPLIEVLTKGLRVKGTLSDIRIAGDGKLDLGPSEVLLNKQAGGTPLSIAGKFSSLYFEDKPAERSEDLKKSLAGQVVESKLSIDSATLEIKDLEEFNFIKGNKAAGIKPELKSLKVNNFAINDITAGGKIWAKFPIFGWLLGKFPNVGKITGEQDKKELTSEIRFDSLETRLTSDGRHTELKNFLIQLFEVDGRKQWAKFKLPLLKMYPDRIETSKDPIELEVYFKDKDRGGDFKFELKDEDLSGRRRRKADQK